jgi:hypothetical protein
MSDTPLAVVVLAHTDPEQLRRLVDSLDDVPVFVHCDARTPAKTFAGMVELLPPRATFIKRVPTSWASWSLVAAELGGVRAALEHTSAEHIAVMSGSDYPLLSVEDLSRELKLWEGQTWFSNSPLPVPSWGTPRHDDGGMWRLEYRYLTRHDNVVFFKNVPLRWPGRRQVPSDVEPRAASQWKIYARHHAQRLLDIIDTRPDLVRFWRSTLVPDESAIASLMASPTLFGSDRLMEQQTEAWYLDWSAPSGGHPRWLDEGDFEPLKAARWAPSYSAGESQTEGLVELPRRKFFARKMSSSSSAALLDRIDAELRNGSASKVR